MSHTIGALYKEGAASLAASDVPEPEHSARVLLAHVLACEPNEVLLRAREPLDPSDERLADHLLSLRRRRMPLPYVTRTTYFGGLALRCDDRALVPRQETEQLVEAVLQRLPGVAVQPEECLADIGCGSGAIGLAIATQVPGLQVVMTDISAEAVELAAENVRHLGLSDRVSLLVGSYLEPLREANLEQRVAALVCNPPYVRPREMSMLDPEVHAEPRVAIASPEADGLHGYRALVAQVGALPNLRLLAFEVGFAQEEDVASLFAPLGKIEILPDCSGIERVVVVHVG